MDFAEAQWQALRPLLTPQRRPDGRGRPWRDARAVVNGILGFCAQVLLGTIYPTAIRPIKPAIVGFNSGSAMAL